MSGVNIDRAVANPIVLHGSGARMLEPVHALEAPGYFAGSLGSVATFARGLKPYRRNCDNLGARA